MYNNYLNGKFNRPSPSDSVIIIKIDGTIHFVKDGGRIIESIAALANTRGGRIYLMKKGANSGIRKDRIDDYRKFWEYDLLPVLRNYLDHIPNLDFGVESAGVPNFEYAVIYVSSYEPTLISYTKNLDVNIVYIRENGRNLRYFPRKQEQIPAKRLRYMFLASGTRQTINTCDYQMINIEKPVEVAYKYMSVDTFIVSLVNRKWRFVEPKKWKIILEHLKMLFSLMISLGVEHSVTPLGTSIAMED